MPRQKRNANEAGIVGRDPWEVALDPWEVAQDDTGLNIDAGTELRNMLLTLKCRGDLTSTNVCLLAYWITAAGARGVGDLAMQPGGNSGNYNRHIESVLHNADNISTYLLPVPVNSRFEARRVEDNICVMPPHDALHHLITNSPDLRDDIMKARADGLIPPYYEEHPVVTNAGIDDVVVPLIMYIDGVPMVRSDGVLGIFIYCPVPPMRRYLVAPVRKGDLCSCGCRGWCTISVVHRYLRWSLLACAEGAFPSRRHDDGDFGKDIRAAVAGAPLGRPGLRKGALVLIKSDLAEYPTSLGLPGVTSNACYCPYCNASTDEAYRAIGDFSPTSSPFPEREWDEFDAACRACEINISVPWHVLEDLRAHIRPDPRDGGARGLGLFKKFIALGLNIKDRLECVNGSLDPYVIFEWSHDSYPTPNPVLTFWRRRSETAARHRSALWCPEIGIVPNKVLSVDYLHTLSKGVFQTWLAFFYEHFFNVNAMGVPIGTWEGRREIAVQHMRARLFQWYDSEAAADPPRVRTRVQNLEPSMFGAPGAPQCALHASETDHFVPFTRLIAHEYRDHLENADLWITCADALVDLLELISIIGYRNPSVAQAQSFCDVVATYCRAADALDLPGKPKDHMLLELGSRTVFKHHTHALMQSLFPN